MKVRIGDVVFEDFQANELDIVIEKLQRVGLLKAESPLPIPEPEPKPRSSPPSIFSVSEPTKEETKPAEERKEGLPTEKSKARGWL